MTLDSIIIVGLVICMALLLLACEPQMPVCAYDCHFSPTGPTKSGD